jgi:hypothetical protein
VLGLVTWVAGRLLTTAELPVAPVFFTAEVLLQALISKVDTASVNGKAIKERDFDDTVDMIVEVS